MAKREAYGSRCSHRSAVHDRRSRGRLFGQELSRLSNTLAQWSGRPVSFEAIRESVNQYNQLADLFGALRKRFHNGRNGNRAANLQNLYNMAVTSPFPKPIKPFSDSWVRLILLSREIAESRFFYLATYLPTRRQWNYSSYAESGSPMKTYARDLEFLPP